MKTDIKHLDIWSASVIRGRDGGEELTRQEMDHYTVQKLRETVLYAAEQSPFYREHLMEHLPALREADEGELMAAFERIPFTGSEDLIEREQDMLCVHPSRISRIVTLATSGSTGAPKRIYFTEEDQELTIDFFDHGMRLIVDDSDRVLILMPARMPGSIGRLLGEGLRRLGAKTVEYGLPEGRDGEMDRILDLMEKEKATCAVALPTHMRMLAERAEQRYAPAKMPQLDSVLLSAEYIPEEDIDVICRAFGCKIYEHYGMTEMGLGCAVSCGRGQGYHIRETDLYLEIIDPDSGQVIRDEHPGEIVFTSLTRKGMPFIRYRTGDISRWILEECPCGSVLKRLDKVGRRPQKKGMLRACGHRKEK